MQLPTLVAVAFCGGYTVRFGPKDPFAICSLPYGATAHSATRGPGQRARRGANNNHSTQGQGPGRGGILHMFDELKSPECERRDVWIAIRRISPICEFI